MAKGYDKHMERVSILNSFGKDLVRRSRSCCELCEISGVKLSVFEVPPTSEDPDYESCIFICETCREQIDNPKRSEPGHWRALNNTLWSETAPIQVMAVRMLKRLAGSHPWAEDLLEQAFLDEETQEWVDQAK